MDATTEPAPVRRPLTVRVTVNPVEPAACADAAREDRAYWTDRYDHNDADNDD